MNHNLINIIGKLIFIIKKIKYQFILHNKQPNTIIWILDRLKMVTVDTPKVLEWNAISV